MKNKKLNYVLVPLVLLIWGTLIVKVINHLRDNNMIITPPDLPRLDADLADSLESYELLANYKDPFIRYQTVQNQKAAVDKNIKNKTNRTSERKPARSIVRWPDISFGGIISHEERQIGLVQVNANSLLLKEGEVRDGICLDKLYKDSVSLIYQGETKTFKKKP
ncbi:MAG: hypothetical protein JW801_19465 [Bacteroidales bacterium]|nr:hypothetical protein [Bacteroidales bacterium]